MLKKTSTYVFEKYFKYKQLCGNSQELLQTLVIIFSKERLVSINEINAGNFSLVLMIVQCRCQSMFILTVGKISTVLEDRDPKEIKKELRRKKVEQKYTLFSLLFSISFQCEFTEALLP